MNDQYRTDLPLEEVCHLLQSQRRRAVLRYLARHDDPVRLGDMAEHIAAEENDVARDRLTPEQRKRVYISLYQTHIPQLEDAGVIEYDDDHTTLTGCPPADHLYEALLHLQKIATDHANEENDTNEGTSTGRLLDQFKIWATS